MRVEVQSATPNPMDVISLAAGVCFGKRNIDHKRVGRCYGMGHMSVFEHASITFLIEGVSRACMAQLTRHRLASFCVESQRYCRIDVDCDDWYVMPPCFGSKEEAEYYYSLEGWFMSEMKKAAINYEDAMADGVKPEDARYLLPEATKTNLVLTCNVRELFHILDMRLDKAAQWEIRNLAKAMLDAAMEADEQWCSLMCLHEDGEL